jgi:hypothetical protein
MNSEEKQKFLKESKKLLKATSKLLENKFKGTQSSLTAPSIYRDFSIKDAIEIINYLYQHDCGPAAFEKTMEDHMDLSDNANYRIEAQRLRTELVNTMKKFEAQYSTVIRELSEYIKSDISHKEFRSHVLHGRHRPSKSDQEKMDPYKNRHRED